MWGYSKATKRISCLSFQVAMLFPISRIDVDEFEFASPTAGFGSSVVFCCINQKDYNTLILSMLATHRTSPVHCGDITW